MPTRGRMVASHCELSEVAAVSVVPGASGSPGPVNADDLDKIPAAEIALKTDDNRVNLPIASNFTAANHTRWVECARRNRGKIWNDRWFSDRLRGAEVAGRITVNSLSVRTRRRLFRRRSSHSSYRFAAVSEAPSAPYRPQTQAFRSALRLQQNR